MSKAARDQFGSPRYRDDSWSARNLPEGTKLYRLDFVKDERETPVASSYYVDEEAMMEGNYITFDDDGRSHFDVEKFCDDYQIAPYKDPLTTSDYLSQDDAEIFDVDRFCQVYNHYRGGDLNRDSLFDTGYISYDDSGNCHCDIDKLCDDYGIDRNEQGSYKNHVSTFTVPEGGLDVEESFAENNWEYGHGGSRQLFIDSQNADLLQAVDESIIVDEDGRQVDAAQIMLDKHLGNDIMYKPVSIHEKEESADEYISDDLFTKEPVDETIDKDSDSSTDEKNDESVDKMITELADVVDHSDDSEQLVDYEDLADEESEPLEETTEEFDDLSDEKIIDECDASEDLSELSDGVSEDITDCADYSDLLDDIDSSSFDDCSSELCEFSVDSIDS